MQFTVKLSDYLYKRYGYGGQYWTGIAIHDSSIWDVLDNAKRFSEEELETTDLPPDGHWVIDPATAQDDITMTPEFSSRIFENLLCPGVIVEGWKHKDFGCTKRAYEAEFTHAERIAIADSYPDLYRWYIETGLPQRVKMDLERLALLQRAVAFFAAI